MVSTSIKVQIYSHHTLGFTDASWSLSSSGSLLFFPSRACGSQSRALQPREEPTYARKMRLINYKPLHHLQVNYHWTHHASIIMSYLIINLANETKTEMLELIYQIYQPFNSIFLSQYIYCTTLQAFTTTRWTLCAHDWIQLSNIASWLITKLTSTYASSRALKLRIRRKFPSKTNVLVLS